MAKKTTTTKSSLGAEEEIPEAVRVKAARCNALVEELAPNLDAAATEDLMFELMSLHTKGQQVAYIKAKLKGSKKRKLNLSLPESVYDSLIGLKENAGKDTLSQTVAHALAIYEFLWERRREGFEIIVVLTVDGEVEEKELVLF